MIKRDRLLKPPVPLPPPPPLLKSYLVGFLAHGLQAFLHTLSLMLRTALQLSTSGTHTSWLSLRSLIKSDGS